MNGKDIDLLTFFYISVGDQSHHKGQSSKVTNIGQCIFCLLDIQKCAFSSRMKHFLYFYNKNFFTTKYLCFWSRILCG